MRVLHRARDPAPASTDCQVCITVTLDRGCITMPSGDWEWEDQPVFHSRACPVRDEMSRVTPMKPATTPVMLLRASTGSRSISAASRATSAM